MASVSFNATSRVANRLALVMALAGFCMLPIDANVFLGRDAGYVNREDTSLLEQLEEVLGMDQRIAIESEALRIEEGLRPTFAAMPQGSDARVNSEIVRYMVHRYFVERHGWFVRGMDWIDDAGASSSPAAIFKEHEGGQAVHSIFDAKLCDDQGFSLNQVAVFAAMIENFVQHESSERLQVAYRFSGLKKNKKSASKEQVTAVMDTYMMMYVLGTNHTSATDKFLKEQRRILSDVYPTWPETKIWMNGVREEVLGTETDTSFNTIARVLEEVGDRYGRWQNRECLDLKDSLVKLEHAGTGRVQLDAFYNSALGGNWQFSESVEYLRQLGALDETDPQKLSVIIPNYVNSPSNCIASSNYYSVCCIDECEALLSHLELHVAASEADPTRIVELVAALPSTTIQAPRTLVPALVGRLEEIANRHGGTVPFHGRLFAQWMHHAYPRECQYPRLSGAPKPLGPEEWEQRSGGVSIADEKTMRLHVGKHVGKAGAVSNSAQHLPQFGEPGHMFEDELPWSAEEELIVSRRSVMTGSVAKLWASAFGVLCLVVIFPMAHIRVREELNVPGSRFLHGAWCPPKTPGVSCTDRTPKYSL